MEGNPKWRGGIFKRKDGYRSIYIGNGKYRLEHRMVMEKYLGRKLKRFEQVHHKNAIRNDNRLENLAIVLATEHRGELACPKCNYHFFIK